MVKKNFDIAENLIKRLEKYKQNVTTTEAAVINISLDDFLRNKGY